MFAYCRNNSVCRIDITGMYDTDCLNDDGESLSSDELDARAEGGGAANLSASGGGTTIYRWHCKNANNLKPSNNDVKNNSPMSFSTQYKPGSAMTTIEQVNGTGVLHAVQDGATHVSVSPINGTIAEWRIAGSNSIWTTALLEIVEFVT